MTGVGPEDPIAIFDSGVGGLSVLRHVKEQLPGEHLLYLADQTHVPYGPRPASQVQQFCEAAVHFFLSRRAKLILVACNTATAAALGYLRATFDGLPFVGMEPAVKPGANATRSGKVGVLATAGTFDSQRYADLMERYAGDVTLYQSPCEGLVELIEAGHLDTPETDELLRDCLQPMLDAGVDTLVLGCTHYPFVSPAISRIAGSQVTLIDPAPAVVRHTARMLEQHGLLSANAMPGVVQAYTTGSPDRLGLQAQQLLLDSFPVTPLHWHEGRLHQPTD
jgi:glutamate racemase